MADIHNFWCSESLGTNFSSCTILMLLTPLFVLLSSGLQCLLYMPFVFALLSVYQFFIFSFWLRLIHFTVGMMATKEIESLSDNCGDIV
jgi:hypothetical protein